MKTSNSQSKKIQFFSLLIESLKKLTCPVLRKYIIAPLCINIVTFSLLFFGTYKLMGSWVQTIINYLPTWLHFLEFLMWPLFICAAIGIFFFMFNTIGNLIAAPFNMALAAKVQQLENPNIKQAPQEKILQIITSSVHREYLKIRYSLFRMLLLLLLSFIPVINLITPFLWILFNSWIQCIQYCDTAAENRACSFQETLKLLKKNRLSALFLGLIVYILMFVPFLNLVVIPLAVIMSCLFWERKIQPQILTSRVSHCLQPR